MPELSLTIEEQIPLGLRLDRYVSEYLSLLSRSQLKTRSMEIKVNGKKVKFSKPVKQGDRLELAWAAPPLKDIIPEDIPLEIIYEDERVAVIDKPQGMVVHPGAGNYSGTLANALAFRRKFNGISGEGSRPGIVHRLDKETSGLIIAAYDDEALAFLSDQFKARKARKTYAVIVTGTPKAKGCVETFIGRDPRDRKKFAVLQKGKTAVTYYKVFKSWGSHSLVLLRPKTGRTHQLRVHLRFIGCPVLGDKVYGFNDRLFPDASLMLHARRLAITLPGNLERTVFTSPVPERFKRIVRCLNGLANGIQ